MRSTINNTTPVYNKTPPIQTLKNLAAIAERKITALCKETDLPRI